MQLPETSIASIKYHLAIWSFLGLSIDQATSDNLRSGIGNCPLLLLVPAPLSVLYEQHFISHKETPH